MMIYVCSFFSHFHRLFIFFRRDGLEQLGILHTQVFTAKMGRLCRKVQQCYGLLRYKGFHNWHGFALCPVVLRERAVVPLSRLWKPQSTFIVTRSLQLEASSAGLQGQHGSSFVCPAFQSPKCWILFKITDGAKGIYTMIESPELRTSAFLE